MIMLTGYNDDLIEVEGDVREEWQYHEDDTLVYVSTGHVFRVRFGHGWEIRLLAGDDSILEWGKREEHEEDDLVFVHADVAWVGCDNRLEKAKTRARV